MCSKLEVPAKWEISNTLMFFNRSQIFTKKVVEYGSMFGAKYLSSPRRPSKTSLITMLFFGYFLSFDVTPVFSEGKCKEKKTKLFTAYHKLINSCSSFCTNTIYAE